MPKEIPLANIEELQKIQLDAIVNAADEIYQSNGNKPVRILDLATGPNLFNSKIVRTLIDRGIDYELTISDILPHQIKRGYTNLERTLTPEELKKVKIALVDSNNLRKQHKKLAIQNKDGSRTYKSIKEILQNPEYAFLASNYLGTTRIDKFKSGTFDIVTGQNAYGNIQPPFKSARINKFWSKLFHKSHDSTQRYIKAIDESKRVLGEDKYHIVLELQVAEINTNIERTPGAMRGAKIKHLDNLSNELNIRFSLVGDIYTCEQQYNPDYYDPDEIAQKGDILKNAVYIHKKNKRR